jgi:hypothetical protein
MDHLQASAVAAANAGVIEAHKLPDRLRNSEVVKINGSRLAHRADFTLADHALAAKLPLIEALLMETN